ncbi:MAG TPA: glycosyltransferase family 1 protein [Terriglobia bacterium]|nr:glycosyltransferase family 1 protein [Terriglobia bacterium]
MRIGINAAFLGGRSDGLTTYTRSIIGELSASGHEVLVYTSDELESHWAGNATRRRIPSPLRAGNGTVGNTLRVTAWCQAALPLCVALDRAQVLLCTLPEGMVVPTCPQVVVVHDIIPLLFPDTGSRWSTYFRYVLPWVLRASRCVIADSQHTKNDLRRHYGLPEGRIEVVYPWVDPVFFSHLPDLPPQDHEDGPFFLFVGRLSPNKNLEMVVRAFAAIRRDVRHRLVCVLGITDDRDRRCLAEILDVAVRLGVRDRLHVYSGLSRAQLLFLYRNATALVLLSKYEGFGYPPLEAMATGTPAIVSDSTSLAEVAGPAGLCVSNTEPDQAAEAMKRLACDPPYRAQHSEAGKAHARTFSRERSGRMIRSILERCAKGVA